MRHSSFPGVAFLLCALCTGASGFSGSVTQDTTWTTDMTITGDVTVRNDAILTILPDLTITFMGYWKLITEVNTSSRIVADSCTFTSVQEHPGAWSRIEVNWGGEGQFRDCEICYADVGIANFGDFNSVLISGCHIHHNRIAVYLNGCMTLARDEPNPRERSITVENNCIEWNEVGIRNDWGRGGSYDGNLIQNNSQAGISLGDHSAGRIIRSQIVDNQIGILIRWVGLGEIMTLIGGSTENANTLCSNVEYDLRLEAGLYHIPQNMTVQYNDWGLETTVEMNIEGYPSDIEAIYDCWDDSTAGCVDYRNWIMDPGGVRQETDQEAEVFLEPAAPDPFQRWTHIAFRVADQAAGSNVILTIHDPRGRLVRKWIDPPLIPGGTSTVLWDGRDRRGVSVPQASISAGCSRAERQRPRRSCGPSRRERGAAGAAHALTHA